MRKLMWFTIGLVVACGTSVYLLADADLSAFAAGGIFLFVLFLILSCLYRWAKPCAAVFLGAAVMFGWIMGFQHFYLAPLHDFDGQTEELTITLTDYSWETQYGSGVEGFVTLGENAIGFKPM